LGQAQTGDDGPLHLSFQSPPEGVSYLVAKGGEPSARKDGHNPAIALMAVLGSNPPAVWTHAQFLDGTAIKGNALGLRIAAGTQGRGTCSPGCRTLG
jgi:hypothetical protein